MATEEKKAAAEGAKPPAANDAPKAGLDEEDEFEEFDEPDWEVPAAGTADAKQWEEDWDDADVRDDFSKQLRAELDAREGK